MGTAMRDYVFEDPTPLHEFGTNIVNMGGKVIQISAGNQRYTIRNYLFHEDRYKIFEYSEEFEALIKIE
jgi:hypothetical protein